MGARVQLHLRPDRLPVRHRQLRQHRGRRPHPPFADSRNNHPQNGLAFSKNAHWMFDVGLWSLDDEYRVLVATNRFDEAGDAAFLLKRMADREIQRPGNRDFWPDKAHMAWHRENRLDEARARKTELTRERS